MNIKVDTEQTFIESIYTVDKQKKCNDPSDRVLHHAWYGATPTCVNESFLKWLKDNKLEDFYAINGDYIMKQKCTSIKKNS